MKVYSWKELNLAITDLLNSIPKDTSSSDPIWRSVASKISDISLANGAWGYNLFSKDIANCIIQKHVEDKFK
jgi:hypothetical protein